MAGKDFVVNRQAVTGLNNAPQDLTSDQSFLRPAKLADLVLQGRHSFSTDRRHVVKNHRQFLVDQRPQQAGHNGVDFSPVIDPGLHAAQQVQVQVRVRVRFRVNIRNGNGFQPAQDAELGVGTHRRLKTMTLSRASMSRLCRVLRNTRRSSPNPSVSHHSLSAQTLPKARADSNSTDGAGVFRKSGRPVSLSKPEITESRSSVI